MLIGKRFKDARWAVQLVGIEGESHSSNKPVNWPSSVTAVSDENGCVKWEQSLAAVSSNGKHVAQCSAFLTRTRARERERERESVCVCVCVRACLLACFLELSHLFIHRSTYAFPSHHTSLPLHPSFLRPQPRCPCLVCLNLSKCQFVCLSLPPSSPPPSPIPFHVSAPWVTLRVTGAWKSRQLLSQFK